MVAPQVAIDFLNIERRRCTQITGQHNSDSEPFDCRTESNSIAFIDSNTPPLSGGLEGENPPRALRDFHPIARLTSFVSRGSNPTADAPQRSLSFAQKSRALRDLNPNLFPSLAGARSGKSLTKTWGPRHHGYLVQAASRPLPTDGSTDTHARC